jgi:3-mercaptopyruvate sulfurtransferase SseA
MTTRKRRRQEAFEEQPEPEVDPVQTEEEAAQAREDKEQAIWDAVREAHYEGQDSFSSEPKDLLSIL